jgi:hypothetical protein
MVMAMRRIQIVIDEELDEALAHQARTENVSKSALIRRYVGAQLTPLPPLEQDPLWAFVGGSEGAPGDSASIDDVVYGR